MAEGIPAYAFDPLNRGLQSVFRLSHLLHHCMHGLTIISKRPMMVERVINLTKETGQEVDSQLTDELNEANDAAAFTNKEIEQGFPMLHASTLVGHWAALEAAIEDMLVGIMCNEPAALDANSFAKIRIQLCKYERLNKEERMRFLLSELQRGEASGLPQGVNSFENVLEFFELAGIVPPDTREALWKLNNIRNVIVHCDSRADRRFVENCPSLNLKVGDDVLVDHETYASLTESVLVYLTVLVQRLASRYNVPAPKWAVDFYSIPKADC